MSIDYVMAVDPGKATGVAIGRFTEDKPLEVIYTAIIPGGTQGFCEWLHVTNDGKHMTELDCMKNHPEEYGNIDYHLDVVCESFQLRGAKFVPDLEPVRIEGVLIDHFGHIMNWQTPSTKTMVSDEFLKEHGLWVTGKDVDHADGRDANDAMIHLFAYAMKIRHIPTLEAYWR